MTDSKSSHPRSNRLISFLLVLLGVVGGYMYASGTDASGADESLRVENSARSKVALEEFADIKFNFSVFDNQDFSTLRTLGRDVIPGGLGGRLDVFAPF